MSDDDDGTPHKTRDEIIKQWNNLTKPLVGPIQDAKDKTAFYLNTGYEHSKRVSPMFQRQWARLETTTEQKFVPYHHYRREFPWEIITGVGVGAFLCSLPYGLQATTRNALFATVATTLIVNPEYLYDQYKFYTSGAVKAKDSTNKSTFQW